MTYAIMSFAVATIIILVNYLLMQEQEQAAVIGNGFRYHLDIARFDEWCEEHPWAGYWKHARENTDMGTFVPTGTPGMSRFVFWEDLFPGTDTDWQPRNEVTNDPQTWPDFPEFPDELMEDGIPDFVDEWEDYSPVRPELEDEEPDVPEHVFNIWYIGSEFRKEVDKILGVEPVCPPLCPIDELPW